MNKNSVSDYCCPRTKQPLSIKEILEEQGDNIIAGILISASGNEYEIKEGIPNFTININDERNHYALNLFREKAKEYDKYQHLSFQTFLQDENKVRNAIIDKLCLEEDSKVLEVNAGTGRDSLLIQQRLSEKGTLHVQDISVEMLELCSEKLKEGKARTEINRSNAIHLPYYDNTFDAVYSFGGVGMNTYTDNKVALAEIVRVTKPGGRIAIGGLSIAPWLRDSLFAKILINHNEHYANDIKLNDIPAEARELNLKWILSGAGFMIDFTKGGKEPEADFHYEIPGVRGGTLYNRYFGQLEGVTPETKKLAQEARKQLGISMHEWLDELIKREAEKILNNKNEI